MNRKVRSIGLVALAVVVLGGALTSCTRESKARAQEAPQVQLITTDTLILMKLDTILEILTKGKA